MYCLFDLKSRKALSDTTAGRLIDVAPHRIDRPRSGAARNCQVPCEDILQRNLTRFKGESAVRGAGAARVRGALRRHLRLRSKRDTSAGTEAWEAGKGGGRGRRDTGCAGRRRGWDGGMRGEGMGSQRWRKRSRTGSLTSVLVQTSAPLSGSMRDKFCMGREAGPDAWIYWRKDGELDGCQDGGHRKEKGCRDGGLGHRGTGPPRGSETAAGTEGGPVQWYGKQSDRMEVFDAGGGATGTEGKSWPLDRVGGSETRPAAVNTRRSASSITEIKTRSRGGSEWPRVPFPQLNPFGFGANEPG